jgi:hypothetical protein
MLFVLEPAVVEEVEVPLVVQPSDVVVEVAVAVP